MNNKEDIENYLIELYRKTKNYNFDKPIRSVGVAVSDFSSFNTPLQYDFFTNSQKKEKLERLDKTVDTLKKRYGNFTIQVASLLKSTDISRFNPHDDHNIHPVGVLKSKI